MANEYAVNQADLQAVADAIRSKGGTSGSLTFPADFISAVGAIETGAGGGDAMFSSLITDTLVDAVVPDEVTTLAGWAFYKKTALKSVSARSVTGAGLEVFRDATALVSVDLPMLKSVGARVFYGCTSLERITLPELSSLFSASPALFSGCTNLKSVNLGRCNVITTQTFQNCSNLSTLVLKATNVNNASMRQLCSLAAVNAFSGTPFAEGGAGGRIYVYEEFIEQYKTATNWATLYDAGTVEFLPIEGSEYE